MHPLFPMEMGKRGVKNGGEEEEQPMIMTMKEKMMMIPSDLSQMDDCDFDDDVSTCKVALVNNDDDEEKKKKRTRKRKKSSGRSRSSRRSRSIVNIGGGSSFDSDDDDYHYEMLKKKWRKKRKMQKSGEEDDKRGNDGSTPQVAVVDERRAAVLAYISSFAYKGGGGGRGDYYYSGSTSTDAPTSPPPLSWFSTPPCAVRRSSNNTIIRKEEKRKKTKKKKKQNVLEEEDDDEETTWVLKQARCSHHHSITSPTYTAGEGGGRRTSKYFSHTSYNSPPSPPPLPPPPHDGHDGTAGSDDKMSMGKQVRPSEEKQEEGATIMPPASQQQRFSHHTVPDIAYIGGNGDCRTSKYFSHTSYNSPLPSVVQQEGDVIRTPPPPPQLCDGCCAAEAIVSPANNAGRQTSRYFSNTCGNISNGSRSVRHNEVNGDANGKLKVKKMAASNDSDNNKKKDWRKRTLSAKERFIDAYKRVPDDPSLRWKPPPSPHNLLQEKHYESPWKVLIICILCNRTKGQEAGKVLEELFAECCSPKETLKVPTKKIEGIIRELGLQRKRAEIIKRLSEEYLKEWNYVTELPGIGKYAADAYAIFCSGRWQEVMPVDQKLELYWKFLNEGGQNKEL